MSALFVTATVPPWRRTGIDRPVVVDTRNRHLTSANALDGLLAMIPTY